MTQDTRAKELISKGDHLFSKRSALLSLWQDIADNFYPERADFTTTITTGDELASNLTTSFPIIARRDLANIFSSMLRPRDKQWFFMRPRGTEISVGSQRWLDKASEIQWRAMYDPDSNFVRATKEGDNDYAAFGQCAIKVELYRKTNTMLYRNRHLKNIAWAEGVDGRVNEVHEKWAPTAQQLISYMGNKVHAKVKEVASKHPYTEINCRIVVIPSESYSGEKKYKQPFVQLYIDVDNCHVMEETPRWTLGYVIPRWQTVAGSQYAYSPATIAALPDARLIQAMTLTLLEAGEKATNPPMVAVQEAIRSDISIYAGGITWVDPEYDERLGEVLRPMTLDTRGIPLGIEMQRDIREKISEAFYLNKVNLPEVGDRTTAFEFSARVSEYVRNAMPLFEPLEMEYNGGLCEETFDTLMRNGAFGPTSEIPDELKGMDIPFVFESPLQEAKEHGKMQKFLEAKSLLAEAAALDQGILNNFNVNEAVRDVFSGIGTPAKWLRSKEEQEQIAQAQAQEQQMQQMMASLQNAGAAAEQIGKGAQAMNKGLSTEAV